METYSGVPISKIKEYFLSEDTEKFLDEYKKERIRYYFVDHGITKDEGKAAEARAEADVRHFEDIAEAYADEFEEKERREEKNRSERQIVVYKPREHEYTEFNETDEKLDEDKFKKEEKRSFRDTLFGKRDKTINVEYEDITEGRKEKEPSKFEKLKTSMFGFPKTEKEKQREQEIKEAEKEEEYKTKLHKIREFGKSKRKTNRGFQLSSKIKDKYTEDIEDREPSLRDLGRGSMGSEKYDIQRPPTESREYKPDFFGKGSGFDFGTANPLGEPSKVKKSKTTRGSESRQSPPSTTIPFGGTRAPSTAIPFYGSRPPSTVFPGRSEVPSTSVRGTGRVSTKVPLVKAKPPSTRIGRVKVHTRIPDKKIRAPSMSTKPFKSLKLSEIKIKRPVPIKTRINIRRENPLDILGLRGYF